MYTNKERETNVYNCDGTGNRPQRSVVHGGTLRRRAQPWGHVAWHISLATRES